MLIVTRLLAALVVCVVVAPLVSAQSLAGLWKARQSFGPYARGTLVVQRSGTGYLADFAGKALPMRERGGELSFQLPNGQGEFRGRLEASGIRGHWYPPNSVTQIFRYVSPVQLAPAGPNRWSGEVVPVDDVFTLYLLLRERPDGSLGAMLANPERDFGSWLGVHRLAVKGDRLELMAQRRGQQDEQVVAHGSHDRDRNVLTLAFPRRGGTYDFTRDDDESDFYPRGRKPAPYVYRRPLARDDGWITGTLEDAAIDRAAIDEMMQLMLGAAMESHDTPEVHALLIARHGKLVFEEYFHGEHRDKLHDTRSASKSLVAVLAGAAIEAGAPLALSTPVYAVMRPDDFPAAVEPQKRTMTLEHLLSMRSGFFCDDTNAEAPGNEDAMLDQEVEPDYYRYTLAVPMASAPGGAPVYCSASANLALGVIGRAAGESPLAMFDRLVATPMKIRRYGWMLDPAGNPYGGGGVQLTARDFLKFGQLMLDDGTWEGDRILSREFARQAASPLHSLWNRGYGYLWWSTEHDYGGRKVRAFYAGGAGGQAVVVIPELELVVGTFGANYSSPGTYYVQQTIIPKHILPAVRERGR